MDTPKRTAAFRLDKLLTDIAQCHLDIATLEPRNRDALDFHEVGVRFLRAALLAAYEAGRAAANGMEMHR